MSSTARKNSREQREKVPSERPKTLEPLAVLEFSKRGALTLPPKVRQKLGGQKVMVEEDELGRIYLAPVRSYRRYTAEDFARHDKEDQLTDEEWANLEKAWGAKLRDE